MSTKIILLSSLMALSSAVSAKPIFTETEDQNLVKTIVTPAFQNPIHPGDLSTTASPQFTIKNSGRYYITNHLSRASNGSTDTILLINASNVSLDLNSKVIAPNTQGAMTAGIGIGVTQGLSNVLIRNGYIFGKDNDAPSATQKLNTGIELAASGSGTSYQIKLQDLQINFCKSTGINASTVNDLTIENCQCNDASGSGAVYGASLSAVNNLKIRNCEFSGNTTSSAGAAVAYGLYLSGCTDGILENSISTANTATSTSYARGFYLTSCKNLQFTNVKALDNTSSGGHVYGFYITSTTNSSFTNCQSNNNNTSSGGAWGFSLDTTSDNCNFNNCTANNNSGTNTTYGFYAQSTNAVTIKNSQFNGNHTSGNVLATGIGLDTTTNINVFNCQICDNYSTGSTSNAKAYGVYQIGSSSNNLFDGCLAQGNYSSAAAATTVVGFYSTGGTNNIFRNCKALRNGASSTANTASIGVGFQFAGAETYSQIVNCDASNNYTAATSASSRAYGIYFLDNAGATKCQVKNCYISYNTAASGLAFGFYDNCTSPSTSVLIGNIAVGQGSCLGTKLDSNLQWNGNVEPTNNQNYFFMHTGTGDDPRNMISEVPHQNFNSISTAIVKWQNISVY